MFEDATKSRLTMKRASTSTVISVPASGGLFAKVFLFLWLCAWAFGEIQVVSLLLTQPWNAGTSFSAIWLALWTVGGGAALATFLWMTFGKEEIEVDRVALRHSLKLLGFSRTRTYRVSDIANWHFKPKPFAIGAQIALPIAKSGSGLCFDYGPRTVQIAHGTDSGEARAIEKAILERTK